MWACAFLVAFEFSRYALLRRFTRNSFVSVCSAECCMNIMQGHHNCDWNGFDSVSATYKQSHIAEYGALSAAAKLHIHLILLLLLLLLVLLLLLSLLLLYSLVVTIPRGISRQAIWYFALFLSPSPHFPVPQFMCAVWVHVYATWN